MTYLIFDSSELESNCTDPSSLVSCSEEPVVGPGTKNFECDSITTVENVKL